MAGHYGLRISEWGPVTEDGEGRLYANVTVTVSPLYRSIMMLQVGLPMIEDLPIWHWPRAFWVLYRAMRRHR